MSTNRKAFFDGIRPDLFGGTLTQDQVNGIDAILDEWEVRKLTDLRWLAYMLATTYHETNMTMQPVREAYWLSEEWCRRKRLTTTKRQDYLLNWVVYFRPLTVRRTYGSRN
jgi:hypothetical protein